MTETKITVENAIIGSGPSGVAVAMALAKKGQKFSIYDLGTSLPIEAIPKFKDSDILSEVFTNAQTQNKNKSITKSRKLVFGSDFSYKDNSADLTYASKAVLNESQAAGGFSTVWGATMLPFTDQELKRYWPSSILQELLFAYDDIASEVELIGCKQNSLSNIYNLSSYDLKDYVVHKSVKRLLDINNLKSKDFFVGKSLLAVNTNKSSKGFCRFCGNCLMGCPYDSILQTHRDILTKVLSTYNYGTYTPSMELISFNERSDGVVCKFKNLNGDFEEIFANRIFIGSGVVSTAKIVIRSLDVIKQVTIKDSQTTFFCALNFIPLQKKVIEKIGLSNVTITYKNKNCGFDNMQVYPSNRVFLSLITNGLPNFLSKSIKLVLQPLIDKLVFGIHYLNEEDSAEIVLDKDLYLNELRVTTDGYKSSKRSAQKSLSKVVITFLKRGFLIIPIFKFGAPGEGVHFGASFPMSSSSRNSYSSDTLGRIENLKRVHIVDGSVIPHIPAGPITFTIMANAYRIATKTTS